MDDVIVLYASPEHLNSILILGKLITTHHPTTPVTILSSAPDSAATSVPSACTYRRIPAPALPADLTKDRVELLFEIPRLNNPQLRDALHEISLKSKIRAFVIDFFCNSAFDVSTAMGIPTYFYRSNGGFGLCVLLYLPTIDQTIEKDLRDLKDYVDIPGCPPIYSSDFPAGMLIRRSNTYNHLLNTAFNMRKSAGFLVNAFDALELRAKRALENGSCVPNGPTPPAYFVGPLVGGAGASAEHECLKWLDSQPRGSVVFLCFGRRGLFSGEQLKEMAVGLENSGHRFLWSVRNPPGMALAEKEDPELDALLPEGFMERTKDRGFVVKSWAPQKEVLSHASVGGFVTHCGRSSILEAVSFGVPMIGWPIYAEQRMNRCFVVEEMGVALPLEEKADDGFVTAAELEKRVRELMESDKGRAVKEKVEEMKEAARSAVEKNGSSLVALEEFINTVTRSG